MSQDTICNKINELEVVSSSENIQVNDEIQQESINELKEEEEVKDPVNSSNESSTTSSSSSSTSNSSSDASKTEGVEPPTKKRRRKRHQKKKKLNTVQTEPEESFKSRYKKLPVFINSAAPKVHLRFDEEGNTDEDKSEYNYKPRIIKALSKNLELHENLNDAQKPVNMEVTENNEEIIIIPEEIISLKPRIIKAIGY